MAGWEQSCCALASLELSGRVCGLLHYPGLPPMGSGSDTDARGTWASRFASLGLSVLISIYSSVQWLDHSCFCACKLQGHAPQTLEILPR